MEVKISKTGLQDVAVDANLSTASSLDLRSKTLSSTSLKSNTQKRGVSIAQAPTEKRFQADSESSELSFIKIFIGCFDATPFPLQVSEYKTCSSRYGSFTSRRSHSQSFSGRRASSRQQSLAIAQSFSNVAKTKSKVVNLDNLEVEKAVNTTETTEDFGEKAPSGFFLTKIFDTMTLPEEATIVLEETETIFLFDMQSVTASKGTEEGDDIEKDNENYNYLTVGKGRNRKTVSTEAQTTECIFRTRHTLAPRTENKHNFAFASAWDMFDSYDTQEQSTSCVNFDILQEDTNKGERNVLKKKGAPKINILAGTDVGGEDILNSTKFLDSVIIMERVLANNIFRSQQEYFKGILEDQFKLEVNSKHNLHLLWTFKFHKTENRPVTAICFNTSIPDIIAVGYGKFEYCDDKDGVICIWSIKNPTQPERLYQFKIAVSCLAFSNGNPNLLAVGFHNGDVIIIDITIHHKQVIAISNRKTSPTYEPVMQIVWYYAEDFSINTEQVIIISQDGRINRYIQTKADKDFECSPMMRIIRVEGTIKSLYDVSCESSDIPILRNSPCTAICRHPIMRDIYFIGTADGYIHKCSTNYMNQHVNVFYAHDGPVHTLQFSPFCPKIFITCGADWTVKIWVENLFVPLMILKTDMNPVKMAVFCPTHSTIIAGISGRTVFIWDLTQKTVVLSTKTLLPDNLSQLSIIQFTQDGKNLLITDEVGGVHVYALLGMEPPQGNQMDILLRSLKDSLIIRPDILKQFKNIDNLF